MKYRSSRATEDVLVAQHERAQRVLHECVLDVYWRRHSISGREHRAGMHFRDCYLHSTSPRITAPPDGAQATSARGSARRDLTEGQLATRERVARMLAMACGYEQRRLLISVCGWNEWASRAFEGEGKPPRRRLIQTLAGALDRVADGLGMGD
jgi:hypothetical protein